MKIRTFPRVSVLILVIVGFFICNCASKPSLDSSKIRQWGPQLENEFPGEEPGLAIYSRGKYQLYYLAASHNNELSSPTLKLVEQLFIKYEFDVLMIESIPNSSGESPTLFWGARALGV